MMINHENKSKVIIKYFCRQSHSVVLSVQDENFSVLLFSKLNNNLMSPLNLEQT